MQTDYLKQFNEGQVKAILHDEGDIMISASAGSGKTRTMIERVTRLIADGKATVKQILASTFTDASATDMKKKLKEKLARLIKEGRADLAEQLNEVASADICTLHSFSGKLCRTYFYIAGIAPDYKIIDGGDASLIKAECIDRVFLSLYEKGDKDFLSLANKFSVRRSTKRLKEIVLKIYEKEEGEAEDGYYLSLAKELYSEEGFIKLERANAEYIKASLDGVKEQAENIMFEARSLNCDALVDFLKGLLDDLDKILTGDLDALVEFKNYKRDLPRKSITEQLKPLKEGAKAVRDSIITALKGCANLEGKQREKEKFLASKNTALSLIKLTDEFRKEYKKQKAEDNVLDFDDLQRYAMLILSDDGVKEEIKQKYKYVFVDEYQDINGVQEQILLSVSNNNLFMVGDPKQSIYGFRGCRPEIFEQKFMKMQAEGGATVRLNANYRCSKAVINMTNLVFNFCMTKKVYGYDYYPSQVLVEGLDYGGLNDGRAYLHMPSLVEEGVSARTQRELEQPRIYDVLKEATSAELKEASETSLYVSNIIRQELGKKYLDKNTNEQKFVTFGDICILTRNKDNEFVEQIVGGLIRRGVPVTSSVERNILDFPEVNVLANFLKLLDCFADSIPLAVTLKSALGGFSEEDLADIALKYQESGEWGDFYSAYNYYLTNGEGELKNRLIAFDNYIKDLRFKADFIGAKGVLDVVIKDKFYIEHLLASFSGEKKVNRVRRFISLMTQDKASLTIYEALNKIRKNKEAFSVGEDTEENAVKVQTIHKSKGLEYPVVILCGLEKSLPDGDRGAPVVIDREWGLGVYYFDDEQKTYGDTLLKRVIADKQKIDAMKEEMRLLYVAMTRAQHSLHLLAQNKKDLRVENFRGASKFIDFIPANIDLEEPIKEASVFSEQLLAKKVIISGEDESLINQMKERFSFKYSHINDVELPLKSSVTEVLEKSKKLASQKLNERLQNALLNELVLVSNLDGETKLTLMEKDEFNRDCHGENAPLSDREKGIIAHAILQNYDFKKGDFDKQIEDMLDKEIILKSELDEVDISSVKSALSSPIFDSAKVGEVYKEQSFLVNFNANLLYGVQTDEEVLIQGVIDLLIIKKNEAEIIDYKYSKAPASVLKERYAKQLDLYARAVEKSLGKKVVAKSLVNILSGEVVKI